MVFNIISDYYPFASGYKKTRYTDGFHKDGNKWRQALYAVAHMNMQSHAPKWMPESAPDRREIKACKREILLLFKIKDNSDNGLQNPEY